MTTQEIIRCVLFGKGVNSESIFDEFLHFAPRWYSKNYWYALGLAYTCADNLYPYREYVKAAFSSKRKGREALMNEEELKVWKNLPQQVYIYRGMTIEEQESGDFGVSWSLSIEKAEFFAYEYTRNHYTKNLTKTVQHLKVDKKDIIAFFNEREEEEVIYISHKE